MTVLVCVTAVCAVLLLAVFMFFSGFYIGGHRTLFFSGKKDRTELTGEEQAKLKREKRELENFWSYSGGRQEKE